MTWEWAAGLRGYFHPSIFAVYYYIIRSLGLDSPWAVAKGAQLLQAAFASATDVHVYKIADLVFGKDVARQVFIWMFTCVPPGCIAHDNPAFNALAGGR